MEFTVVIGVTVLGKDMHLGSTFHAPGPFSLDHVGIMVLDDLLAQGINVWEVSVGGDLPED